MATDAVTTWYNGAGVDENAEACRTRERLLRPLCTGIAFGNHRGSVSAEADGSRFCRVMWYMYEYLYGSRALPASCVVYT